eukprot:6198065-Pleurochrysis_carterae.AAC.3
MQRAMYACGLVHACRRVRATGIHTHSHVRPRKSKHAHARVKTPASALTLTQTRQRKYAHASALYLPARTPARTHARMCTDALTCDSTRTHAQLSLRKHACACVFRARTAAHIRPRADARTHVTETHAYVSTPSPERLRTHTYLRTSAHPRPRKRP